MMEAKRGMLIAIITPGRQRQMLKNAYLKTWHQSYNLQQIFHALPSSKIGRSIKLGIGIKMKAVA